MILILSVLVLAVGLWQLISPRTWFNMTQGWKNFCDEDPSIYFSIFCRVCGAVCTVAGIAGIVVSFME